MRWISKLSIPFILITAIWCSSNIHWNGESRNTIVQSDGKGYYAYLPALFIYHDLHFNFFDPVEKKYYNPNTYYDFRTQHNGRTVDKYFAGTALAELPFFLIAHGLTKLSPEPADGYSKFYPVLVNIAALFYLLLGLIYTRNLLRAFQVNDNLIAFILLLLVYGTNLFYYAVVEPGMSHVYSFAFIGMFVYYARKFFITHHKPTVFYCAALLGVIVLIRPVNGLIVLSLPFIAGSNSKLREGVSFLLGNFAALFLAALMMFLIAGIQPLLYLIQTGDAFIYTYGGEGFNWLHPHALGFLFSYKKGLFVYTPLLFFSLPGFIYLWKNDRYRFWSLLVFSGLLVYVLCSWWNWWYGGSFGQRVMIDYYIFAALLIAFAYKRFEKRSQRIVLTTCFVLSTLLCIAQTYQYRYNIIHWENMDKEKYWDNFLRFDKILRQ
ncbi:MAG TPA: hypothetical protein VI112_11450 [Bacteroidia bacterium]